MMPSPLWLHSWGFVIASYGLSFVGITTIAMSALLRLKRALRKLAVLEQHNTTTRQPPL